MDATLALDTAPGNAHNDQATVDQFPRKKKTRLTAPGPRKKLGRLTQILAFPMDVLFEIFGHLKPRDLLQLARTTKALRHILMHRSSISVWKAARMNVECDFPDCPPDLSEPEYASLAFDSHCDCCWKAYAPTTHWECRVRFCASCSKRSFQGNLKELISSDLHDENDAAQRNAHSHELMGCIITSDRDMFSFIEYQHSDFLEDFKALSGDEAERAKLVAERKSHVEGVMAHASACRAWVSRMYTLRTIDRNHVCRSRADAIIKQLESLGWGKDIVHGRRALLRHPLVNQPKELTPRIWSNIQARLTNFMQGIRAHRIPSERAALLPVVYLEWRTSVVMQATDILPDVADFCSFPQFRNILSAPLDVELDVTSFAPIMETVHDSIATWRRHTVHTLFNLLPEYIRAGRKEHNEKLGALSLAVVWFERAGRAQMYPECLESRWPKALWNSALTARATTLVTLSGLDPLAATRDDMDAVDARFACCHWQCDCNHSVVNWTGWLEEHWPWREATGDCARLTPEATAQCKALEKPREQPLWACALCLRHQNGPAIALSQMKAHYECFHPEATKDTYEEGVDYRRRIGRPVNDPEFVRLADLGDHNALFVPRL